MPPATAPRISRPHRHTAVLPMDGSERRCQRLQETFRRTASCRRADHGKSCRHFALVSRGHRSDRTPPRESPRHFAARMDESVIVGYYTSAEVPSPRRRQPGTPFVKPSVRRIHIAHRRCEQGFQGAQHPWHTTLVQSLVCYTFPEVYTFLKCKKPHTQHLNGADMGLDASSA